MKSDWLECISYVRIPSQESGEEGRGSKGIIGIFFFHFLGSGLNRRKTVRNAVPFGNRNLLILN